METVYEADDNQVMDEQSGTASGDTNTKNSSVPTLKRTPLTSQVGGDDSDMPSTGGAPRLSFVRKDETNLDDRGEFASEESAGENPITVGGVEGVEEVAQLHEEIGNPEGQEGIKVTTRKAICGSQGMTGKAHQAAGVACDSR